MAESVNILSFNNSAHFFLFIQSWGKNTRNVFFNKFLLNNKLIIIL